MQENLFQRYSSLGNSFQTGIVPVVRYSHPWQRLGIHCSNIKIKRFHILFNKSYYHNNDVYSLECYYSYYSCRSHLTTVFRYVSIEIRKMIICCCLTPSDRMSMYLFHQHNFSLICLTAIDKSLIQGDTIWFIVPCCALRNLLLMIITSV